MIKLPSPLTSRRLVALPPTRLSFLSSSFSTSTRRASPTTTRASTSTSSSSSCPTCQAPRVEAGRGPTCRSCQSLLPPPRATSEIPNHYETLSPAGETTGTGTDSTPRYAVDLSHLKRQFLALQRLVHPDRFTQSGNDVDNAQEWAKVWSARVNDAWKTLSNDRERAEYLLSLHGVTIGEADPVTDPELLMSIMETRESLEEAESSDQVEQIRAENSQQMKRAVRDLVRAFDETRPPDLDSARNLVIQLKYLDNVETVCREWSPGKRVELQS